MVEQHYQIILCGATAIHRVILPHQHSSIRQLHQLTSVHLCHVNTHTLARTQDACVGVLRSAQVIIKSVRLPALVSYYVVDTGTCVGMCFCLHQSVMHCF